jgi:ribose 5-phosphate isomerase B
MRNADVYIGSDHAGFKIKQILYAYLKKRGFTVHDEGPAKFDPLDDYPDYALKVCKGVLERKAVGVLVCGSGQGMDIAANKIPGIYASIAWNRESAAVAKQHDRVNVLCLAGKLTKPSVAKEIVSTWLNLPFSNEERHLRRINKIKRIENAFLKQHRI